MKQRHQILLQGLQGDDLDTTRKKKKVGIEDIELAHARRDVQNSKSASTKSIVDELRNSLLPASSSSDHSSKKRSSKVLEALDIDDRKLYLVSMH